MPRPKLVCFIGDLHAGSKVAVATEYVLDDGDVYRPSLHQQWLYDCFVDCIKRIKKHAKGRDIHLKIGGDCVDGHHHDSTQVFGTPEDQHRLAVELLSPLADIASRIDGLRGTDAHVRQSGNDDRAVYRALGVSDDQIRYRFIQDYDGMILDWAHHMTTGRLPHTRGNSLKSLLNAIYFDNLERGRRQPALIVRHHVHIYDDVADHRKGIRAVSCPAWQLQTAYTRRLSPHGLCSVGVVLWMPDTRQVIPILYEPEQDTIETVR